MNSTRMSLAAKPQSSHVQESRGSPAPLQLPLPLPCPVPLQLPLLSPSTFPPPLLLLERLLTITNRATPLPDGSQQSKPDPLEVTPPSLPPATPPSLLGCLASPCAVRPLTRQPVTLPSPWERPVLRLRPPQQCWRVLRSLTILMWGSAALGDRWTGRGTLVAAVTGTSLALGGWTTSCKENLCAWNSGPAGTSTRQFLGAQG